MRPGRPRNSAGLANRLAGATRLALRALPKYLEEALAADGVVEWVESESRYRLRETEAHDG